MDLHDKDTKVYEKVDFKNGNIPVKPDRQRWKNTNFISSFEFAVTGIWTAFKQERNMRKHAISTVLAILCGLFFPNFKSGLALFIVVNFARFHGRVN